MSPRSPLINVSTRGTIVNVTLVVGTSADDITVARGVLFLFVFCTPLGLRVGTFAVGMVVPLCLIIIGCVGLPGERLFMRSSVVNSAFLGGV